MDMPATNDFDRRQFLLISGKAVAGLLVAASGGEAALAAATHKILLLPNPPLDDPSSPSFDVFYRLCQLVTGRIDLDMEIAIKMFEAFRGEPWVEKHISTSYQLLLKELEKTDPQTSVPQLLSENLLKDGEKWFASHIITTWYLGVYYHPERENVRVTYEGALMHEIVADYRPVPGFSDLETGYWAYKPTAFKTGED